jgi:hypothetical protein
MNQNRQFFASARVLFTGRFFQNVYMFLLFSLCPLLLYRPVFQNDTYWLVNTGKYILHNGIPHMEPFTIHEGLNFIVQQWLTTVIFFFTYEKTGAAGLHIMTILLYAVIIFLIYRLAFMMAQGKTLVASYIAAFIGIYLSYYMVPRPQIFSLLIFVIEVFLLEYYTQDKQKKLFTIGALPILSVALINLHSAMWPFFFLLFIPYLIDSFTFRIGRIEGQGYDKTPLFAGFFASIGVGLLNPYGSQSMTYLIDSYGNSMVNNYIHEMLSPDFKSPFGLLVFSLVLTIVLIYFFVRGTTRLRFILLTLGTLYMGLSSIRSFSLFVVFGLVYLAYYLKDIDLSTVIPTKRRVVLIAIAVLVLALVKISRDQNLGAFEEEYKPTAAVQYLKNHVDLSKMRLYNGYNTGGYIEFSGIKTFLDSRAEIFTKKLNGKEDILGDYFYVMMGKTYYSDFVSKYSFTHFLVYKEELLDNCLKHDKKYRVVFHDKKYVLYEKTS